jgi:hypothetical protein
VPFGLLDLLAGVLSFQLREVAIETVHQAPPFGL